MFTSSRYAADPYTSKPLGCITCYNCFAELILMQLKTGEDLYRCEEEIRKRRFICEFVFWSRAFAEI